jgi:hypothetical protein
VLKDIGSHGNFLAANGMSMHSRGPISFLLMRVGSGVDFFRVRNKFPKFSITAHFVLDALPDVSEYWDLICLEQIFLY